MTHRQSVMLHPRFAGRILVNAGLIWIGIRFGAMLVGVGLSADLPAVGAIVLLSATLVLLDLRRRQENAFLENLGVSRATVVLLALLSPVVGEGLCAVAGWL